LIVQIFGKFLLGWFYDKKGILFSQLYSLVCFIGCTVLLIFSRGSVVTAYAFGAVFGLVGSMTTVTPPYLVAKIVGVRDYATIFGIVSLFYGLGVATGPITIEGLFETVGWTPIWIALMIMSAVMAFTTVFSWHKGKAYASLTE